MLFSSLFSLFCNIFAFNINKFTMNKDLNCIKSSIGTKEKDWQMVGRTIRFE